MEVIQLLSPPRRLDHGVGGQEWDQGPSLATGVIRDIWQRLQGMLRHIFPVGSGELLKGFNQ